MIDYLRYKWRDLTEWAAWSAWNYARRRTIRRARWIPGEAQDAIREDTPDARRITANEARQVLENRHFVAAWNALDRSLEGEMLSFNVHQPGGPETAARMVIARQLLHGLRREFARKLTDGYMAEVELDEIARANRARIFRR